MEVHLPADVTAQFIEALRRAGRREIGGILMGECLVPDCFRVTDFTIQSRGGSFVTFIRSLMEVLDPLHRFFRRTGHKYRRFNYLGEWHSHPSFPLDPSARDLQSMREIVEDPKVGATFAVLLIVRLGAAEELEGTVTVFVSRQTVFQGQLVLEATA